MNKQVTDELFGLVRQVPTELSREQVAGIIQTLPTLPLGKTWFKKFNLNSIIMTTTAITIVGSALLYFLSVDTKPEAHIPTESKTPEVTVTEPVEEVTDTKSPATLTLQKVIPPVVEEKKVRVSKDQNEVIPSTTEEPKGKKEADPIIAKVTAVNTKINNVTSTKPSVGAKKVADPVKISPSGLRKLKRQFIKYIGQDNLTNDQNGVNELSYSSESLKVNGKEVDKVLYKKYADLMINYQIIPDKDQKLVTHKDYILVGRFTDEGFKGEALGKNMNIEFYDDPNVKNDLFDETLNDIGNIPIPSPLSNSTLSIPKESVINPTQKYQQKLIDSGRSNESLLDNKRTNRNRKASKTTTSTSKGNEPANSTRLVSLSNPDQPLTITVKEVKKLKRALYNQLNADDIISTNRDNVRMLIRRQEIEVNGQKLNEKQFTEYVRILDKYRVERGSDRKILMSADFIFVGKFNDEQFDGTMQGKMNSETVIGTILEEDLMSLAIFNNEIVSANGMLTIGEYTPPNNDNKGRISKDQFQSLREDIISYLGSDGLIESENENIILTFTNNGLTANESRIKDSSLVYYQRMLSKYGIELRNDRKILIKGKTIILADLDNKGFHFEIDSPSERIKITAQRDWSKLEKEVFGN